MNNGLYGLPPGASQGKVWPQGWSKIGELIVPSDTTVVDIRNIPQNFRHIKIIGDWRSAGTAAGMSLNMQLNDVATAVYTYKYLLNAATGTTTSDTKVGLNGLWYNYTVKDAYTVFSSELTLEYYADSGTAKSGTWSAWNSSSSNGGNTQIFLGWTFGINAAGAASDYLAPISSIKLFPSAQSIRAGSRATIYGLA